MLLTDKYAIRVEGMGKISKGRSAPGVLRELRKEYPGRTPVLVRTVHPEVEKALVHVEADDFRKLLAWDEKEVRL